MIAYEEAVEIIRAEAAENSLETEDSTLSALPGRVCAVDVISPVLNQPFDNAAMDGYALRAEDLAAAANDNPVMLEMIARVVAGDGRAFKALRQGECYEIMTGAPLPLGCDTVVPVENTVKSGARVQFTMRAEQGDNIRCAGEDFRAGDVVIAKGGILDEGHILALATLGVGAVRVFTRPSVALISTGREIVDDLSARLDPGQIYNSTKPYLESALSGAGGDVRSFGTVADDPAAFKRKLRDIMDHKTDIAVSTGAVSAGAHDFVPSVLKDLGAEIFFHKVAIRPGKPLVFARLPSGALFFGLPGNPMASAAGLRFFIQPALRALRGLSPEQPYHAVLEDPYRKKCGLTQFARARILCGGNAVLYADISPRQQSFMVKPFTDTNGWAIVPAETENIAAGEKIRIMPDGNGPFHLRKDGIVRC